MVAAIYERVSTPGQEEGSSLVSVDVAIRQNWGYVRMNHGHRRHGIQLRFRPNLELYRRWKRE